MQNTLLQITLMSAHSIHVFPIPAFLVSLGTTIYSNHHGMCLLLFLTSAV